MILEARHDWNTLTASWSPEKPNTNYWNILISQIRCHEVWAPPPGCLQYFTGVTGQISSYNFQGGLHLANQLYTNCIRQELNHCSINYAASDGDFQISSSTATTQTGNLCSEDGDYITIPDGGATAGSNTNFARWKLSE